jgi:hypothetical protein
VGKIQRRGPGGPSPNGAVDGLGALSYALDAACRAVAEASLDEVQAIVAKAEALAAYARQAKNLDLEADADEIRMRTTRRRIDSVSPAIGSSNSMWIRPRASSLALAAAKLRGVYKGRPASIDAAKVAALKAEGLGATEIAKRLNVGRASVYRLLAS